VNTSVRALASFRIGDRAEFTRTVTEHDVERFAEVSGDDNAIHLDETLARRTRFGGRIVHGALSFGFMAAAQTRLVGFGAVWLDASVKFLAPVRIGDTVSTVAEIAEIDHGRRILTLRATATTAAGTVVMTGQSTVKHSREVDTAPA
jgi:3-hydroxybutyryl-CoA dehydratase